MKAFFNLIRWKNLLMIAFTMLVMHYVLIYGLIKYHTIEDYSFILKKMQVLSFDFELQLADFQFSILVLSVLLIAAGGYIINDVFDKNIDAVNKKTRNPVGKTISVSVAEILYFITTILGILGSLWVSYSLNLWQLSFIFIITAGLLYFYSANYQSVPFVGNLLVALIVAIVPFLIPIFDVLSLNKIYRPTLLNYGFNFNFLFIWVGGFAFFAFLTTLIREIVKDTEDFEGDKAMGQNTIPIKFGSGVTKVIIISLSFILILGVLWINYFYFPNHIFIKYNFTPDDVWWQQIPPASFSSWYSFIFIIFPSIFVIYKVFSANDKKDYAIAGNLIKLIMILGISYSFVIAYSFLNFQILVQ
ncbi:MAG: geranylgeranylglycerol-phosphate geranylgeranyltransferase [Bacteroidales bacterium]|nr:geranylgeranylglycerol-phosphate geranylgeranyltransferase [Bacteroidales bacterium]